MRQNEDGPGVSIPRPATSAISTTDRKLDQGKGNALPHLEVVYGTEFSPVGRARYPTVIVEHEVCGHVHPHRRFETDDQWLVRSPQCAPHREYLIQIVDVIPRVTRSNLCSDCGYDTAPADSAGSTGAWEWYSVHGEVWAAATSSTPARILCIACIEQRLGRRLTPADFQAIPINMPDDDRAFGWRTKRLADHLGIPDGAP